MQFDREMLFARRQALLQKRLLSVSTATAARSRGSFQSVCHLLVLRSPQSPFLTGRAPTPGAARPQLLFRARPALRGAMPWPWSRVAGNAAGNAAGLGRGPAAGAPGRAEPRRAAAELRSGISRITGGPASPAATRPSRRRTPLPFIGAVIGTRRGKSLGR